MMNDPDLQFKTPGTVWVGHDLYIDRPEAVQPLLAELREIGYEIKDCREDYRRKEHGVSVEQMEKDGAYLWYAHLNDIRRGKCGSCQSYISTQGIGHHGHVCEVCGAITYLHIKDGSGVRFSFAGEAGFLPPQLQMKAYKWDAEQGHLYLYPEPLKSGSWGVRSGDEALDLLAKHQDKYERVDLDGKALLKMRYADSWEAKDHEQDSIEVSEVYDHYWNHKIVRLWEGKEYGEWGNFPLPESMVIYEAFHWSPLQPSPTLHERIIHAAGMVVDQGYYYQDGRAAFDGIHWQRMRVFVDHFTAIDVTEWDKAEHRFRRDGPGAIADIARFCSDNPKITNKPNRGNTLVAMSKIFSGQSLTSEEVDAAKRGMTEWPL